MLTGGKCVARGFRLRLISRFPLFSRYDASARCWYTIQMLDTSVSRGVRHTEDTCSAHYARAIVSSSAENMTRDTRTIHRTHHRQLLPCHWKVRKHQSIQPQDTTTISRSSSRSVTSLSLRNYRPRKSWNSEGKPKSRPTK